MKKLLALLAILAANIMVYSQITVTNDSPTNLVQNVLLGGGIVASSITSQGNPDQFSSFTALPGTPIDFSSGLVISTFGMNAPDCLQQGGSGYFGAGTPGDADLTATAGLPTYNAAWIQFDFIPTGDTLKFDYIFASTEYNNYVNSSFNDVFAFYLSGPNPMGGSYVNENVALIPGTSLPVTINNLNNGQSGGCSAGPCEYCSFYIDNCSAPANSPVTGGYTTDLRVVAPVYACSTYTIKMGIADVSDGALNSFVMLKEGSFASNQVGLSGGVNFGPADTLLVEDCNLGIITFIRTDTTTADTIFFNVAGTATMGADYTNLPPEIIFPVGVDTVQLVVDPFNDFTSEGPESIILTINTEICGNPTAIFNYWILDIDSLQATLIPDTAICAGSSVLFNATPSGGIGLYTGIGWDNPGGGTFGDSTSVNVTQPGYYVYHFSDFCVGTPFTDSVRIDIFPVPTIALPDQDICSLVGEPIGPSGTLSGFNYQWSPPINLDQTDITNPLFNGTNPGPGDLQFTYTLTADSAGFACYEDSLTITLHPTPIVDLGNDTTSFCENSSVILNAGNPGYDYLWNTAATSQTITVNTPGIYGVLITSPFNCIDADSIVVGVDSLPHFQINDVTVCEGDSAVLWVHANEGTSFLWSTLETDTMIFTFTPGYYNLAVTNSCGTTVDTAQVNFLPDISNVPIPNVLTPNGDGINDEYIIPILSEAISFRLDFFDRWGALLHTQTDINDWWKGTGQGDNIVPPGTYYVIISYFDCQNIETVKTEFISVFY